MHVHDVGVTPRNGDLHNTRYSLSLEFAGPTNENNQAWAANRARDYRLLLVGCTPPKKDIIVLSGVAELRYLWSAEDNTLFHSI